MNLNSTTMNNNNNYNNNGSIENKNDIDFASLLLNINPNDYMLPTINFTGGNIIGGSGTNTANTTATTTSSIGGGWEWSAFNSGMVSAASIDCHNIDNSLYQMKNLSNMISGISSTNSKGNSLLQSNIYPQNNNIMPFNQRVPMSVVTNQQQNNQNNISQLAQIENLISLLSNNVSKISNYEIDAQRAYNCLPQAINFLNNNSVNEATRSAYLMYLLSKKEACRYVLCGCNNLSETLVNAILRFQNNPNIVRYCTAIIYHLLSNNVFINQYISTNNSIQVICDLTISNVEATAFYAVATVHTLLVKFPKLRNQVLATNCFDKLVPLLKLSNFKFVTLIADVLHFLIIGNLQVQLNVVNTGLHIELIQILKNCKFEKLLFTVCRFIKSLSTNQTVKLALINIGIMNVLTELLLNKSRRLACTSLWALRNFSDVSTNDTNLKELLLICTRFILSQITEDSNKCNDKLKKISEPSLVSCAVGILANLTCNNQDNKETLVRHGGLEALVTLCSSAYYIKDIIEPTMCALRNVTSQHKFIDHTIATLKSLNSFNLLSNCLNLYYNENGDDFFPQLKRATMPVISNIIINNESTLVEFFNLQIPHKTIQILRFSVEIIKQFFSTNNEHEQKEINKQISLYNKLVEDAIILLFIFVGSVSNNKTFLEENDSRELINLIITSEFLDTIAQLLFCDSPSVLSCVLGIFNLISKSNDGINLIKQKYFQNDIQNNESISKMIVEQLSIISSSNKYDQSIKSAASLLFSNWNSLNNMNSCIFNAPPPPNNSLHNLNNLGINPVSQSSPYHVYSMSSTPTNQNQLQQCSNQMIYNENLISNQNSQNNQFYQLNQLNHFNQINQINQINKEAELRNNFDLNNF